MNLLLDACRNNDIPNIRKHLSLCRNKFLFGQTVLHITTDITAFKVLVNEGDADINAMDDQCLTPLHVNACSGNIEICKYLLRNNALIKEDAVGYTPLHYAAMGQFEIVEMLLDRGCDPEQRSYFNGKSSIDCALGYPAIIQMMQKVKSVIRPPDANIGSWIIAEPDHTPDRADRTDRTERSGGHTMSDDDASDDDASDDDSVLSVQDYFRKIFCF